MLKCLKMRTTAIFVLAMFVVAMLFSVFMLPATAAAPAVLKLSFNTANAVKGAVADKDLSDFYIAETHFDLGAPQLGTVAFDTTEQAASVSFTGTYAGPACGTRIYISAKAGVSPILGTDYRYMKVKFKSSAALNATTTLALRDAATDWGYYCDTYEVSGTTWEEVVFDLSKTSTLTPPRAWSTASLGTVGGDFCLEILDQAWGTIDDNLKVYLDSITFYATEDDLLGENTSSGTEDTSSGTEDTSSGTEDTSSGTEDTSSGTEDTSSSTEKASSYKLNFNTKNAVKGAVPDADLSDFYLEKTTFDLALGDTNGTAGFDAAEKAVYATYNKAQERACGTRFWIRAKEGVDPILGTDYQYMKVKFKSTVPLNATTTLALRDGATDWGYYGVTYDVSGTGWNEVLIDLSAAHSLKPARAWNTAELGGAGTFCLEILDQKWGNDYKAPDFKIYLESIAFYANKEDALSDMDTSVSSSTAIAPTGIVADPAIMYLCLLGLGGVIISRRLYKRRKVN